jgi:hypothetical protein
MRASAYLFYDTRYMGVSLLTMVNMPIKNKQSKMRGKPTKSRHV